MQVTPHTLVTAEISKPGQNIKTVAAMIGYARPSLSLYLHGKYPAKTVDKIEAAILLNLADRVICPHLDATITRPACQDYRTRQMPQSSPSELRHWTACQACPLYLAFSREHAS